MISCVCNFKSTDNLKTLGISRYKLQSCCFETLLYLMPSRYFLVTSFLTTTMVACFRVVFKMVKKEPDSLQFIKSQVYTEVNMVNSLNFKII